MFVTSVFPDAVFPSVFPPDDTPPPGPPGVVISQNPNFFD